VGIKLLLRFWEFLDRRSGVDESGASNAIVEVMELRSR